MRDADLITRRLAIIFEIVSRLNDTGKTNIQKIVYFIQEAIGVPLTYSFRMHYYGPYSEDLDGDIALLQSMGYIGIEPDSDGFGFHVTPTDQDGLDWPQEVEKFRDSVSQTIDNLGRLSTWELELNATLHFVNRLEPSLTKEEVLSKVKYLKPKFTLETIDTAYSKLQVAGLISV